MPLIPQTKSHVEKREHEVLDGARHQHINATLFSALPTDENGVYRWDDSWILPEVGTYKNKATYTFGGNTLPTGLLPSDYGVQDRHSKTINQIPYNHRFDPDNVRVTDGFLSLTVPGGQKPGSSSDDDTESVPISCAEIVTGEGNIRYASVRTRAIFSKEPGSCHGLFYYKRDSQEADIEYLTDPASRGNDGEGYTIPLWYSNQADAMGKESTHVSKIPPGDPPMDPTNSVHEHRIDWTPETTEYFFDGNSRAKFTKDVPQEPGHWVWNNWANGDPGTSCLFSSHDVLIAVNSMVCWSTS